METPCKLIVGKRIGIKNVLKKAIFRWVGMIDRTIGNEVCKIRSVRELVN